MSGLVPEIHWEDGLLLRPQHLQAFQRHCQGLIGQLSLSRSFGWGVRVLSIRAESVGNFILEVESCEAVMPDGSVFVAGETGTLRPCEFRHLELDAPTLDVWLAVPMLDPNAANIREGGAGSDAARRFELGELELADENTGLRPQSVQVQRLNGLLFVGQRPPQGHVTMKIAELKKVFQEGEEGRRYELSDRFVPACLTLEASTRIQAYVKDIRDRVEEKSDELLGHFAGRRDLLTGDSVERPDTLLKIQAVNSIVPVLRQLAAQPEMHPFDVFLMLTRLVGDLAIFGEDKRPPRIPIYQHGDPFPSFAELRQVTLELLDVAVQSSIERCAFQPSPDDPTVLVADLPATFMGPGVELKLGVETSDEESVVAGLFTNGRTVAASPDEIPMVRRARIDGVECRLDAHLHPSLRDNKGLRFLAIQPSGDFWPAVESSKRLAVTGEAVEQAGVRFWVYAVGVKGGGR